jgi:hypothetical protein
MRTPSRFASNAAARENITIAAIAAPMTVSPGVATFAASEATLMIEPPLRSRIAGSTACVIWSGGRTSLSMIVLTSAIGISCKSLGRWLGPDVFTSTSMAPSSDLAASSASITAAGSVGSTATKLTLAPGARSRQNSQARSPR